MNRLATTLVALVIGLLAGCGGGSGSGSGSADSSTGSGYRPSEGFSQGNARTKAGDGDYRNVNVFLRGNGSSPYVCRPHDFATGDSGRCEGEFAFADPLKAGSGEADWQYVHSPDPRPFPRAVIKVTMKEADSGYHIDCYLSASSSADCLTAGDQAGKDAGTQGGPLILDPHVTVVRLKGWCPQGNQYCTPHK